MWMIRVTLRHREVFSFFKSLDAVRWDFPGNKATCCCVVFIHQETAELDIWKGPRADGGEDNGSFWGSAEP